MLNLLTKTKPWMVASLIVATSVFGQNNGSCPPKTCPPKPCPKPCPQPCPPTQVCPADPCCPAWPTPVLNAAYNYPARVQTRCPWDVFADATFVYWQAVQENMELGFSNTVAVASAADTTAASVINMDFDFKPGFKVGLGGNFDYDNWDMRLGYTWFHCTNSQSSTAPAGGHINTMWGSPSIRGTATYDSIGENWALRMDIADLDLGRWHYVGTKLVFHPTFGVRADWLRQNVKVTADRAAVSGGLGADTAVVTEKSRSWAIGPKVGLGTNWNIGAGFRFFGNGEADLLFTKYTRDSFKETHTIAPTETFHVKQNRIYAVRPHLDLELGFGWGTYLDCNNWYMDFALGYEFQVFFNQNMFRHFNDAQMIANSNLPNGDLFLQGLTASFKLDF